MKKQLAFILACTITLNACSTTVAMRDELSYRTNNKEECGPRRSIMVNAFDWSDQYLSEKHVTVSRKERLETLTKEALVKSGCFSSVKLITLPSEKATFKNDELTTEFLKLVHGKVDTNFVVDVYSYSETHGYHGNGLMLPYFIWFTIHLASLGLIPVWTPTKIILKAKIYDEKGNLLSNIEVENSANLWTWSPFIFKSNAKKLYEAAEGEYFQNAVTTLVNNIVAKTIRKQ